MDGIGPTVPDRVTRRIIERLRKTRDAGVHRRYRIMLNLINGRTVAHASRVVGVAESTVRRVAHRFVELGEVGLLDGREDNGDVELDERSLSILDSIVRSSLRLPKIPSSSCSNSQPRELRDCPRGLLIT
jgi:hypothetical protein